MVPQPRPGTGAAPRGWTATRSVQVRPSGDRATLPVAHDAARKPPGVPSTAPSTGGALDASNVAPSSPERHTVEPVTTIVRRTDPDADGVAATRERRDEPRAVGPGRHGRSGVGRQQQCRLAGGVDGDRGDPAGEVGEDVGCRQGAGRERPQRRVQPVGAIDRPADERCAVGAPHRRRARRMLAGGDVERRPPGAVGRRQQREARRRTGPSTPRADEQPRPIAERRHQGARGERWLGGRRRCRRRAGTRSRVGRGQCGRCPR